MSDIQEEQKRLYKIAEENDIKLLQEENIKLKELCNKYEEEHKTTFEEWKKDIEANKKAVELLLDKYVRGLLNDNEVNNIVKILKGDNK